VPALNPFDFSKPASAEELIDRERDLELLTRLVEANSNSRLTAPRRYGKTTLLRRVRAEVEGLGMNTVYINLYGLLSVREAADRIEDAYRKSLHGAARNLAVGIIRTFQPSAKIPKTGVSIEPTIEPEIGRRLSWLLDIPVKIMEKTGTPTLVVFDEFQDILLTKPPLDGLIRARLEQHEKEASYIFAGSHPAMMRRLFGDRTRPFYGQARSVRLGPLPEDALANYIGERFSRSGKEVGEILDPLLATAKGHPQRAMLLAHFLWEETAPGGNSDAASWQAALGAVYLELRDELNSIWDGLADSERRMLAAIAAGPGPMRKGVLDELGLARSTARDARDRLIDEGYVWGDDESLEIVDPLLSLWAANGRQGLVGTVMDG
jgi:hypothetical protein